MSKQQLKRPFPVKPSREDIPRWLQQLQLNSWEPEILLSGIVLLGLFQVPGLLDRLLAYLEVNMYGEINNLDSFINWVKIAVYWLTIGLTLHLISRGIWVGMIGLSFIMPQGINFKRLRLSPRFERFLRRIPSNQEIIIAWEKLCSSLFSISFMLFMSLVGGYLAVMVTIVVPALLYFIFLYHSSLAEIGGEILAAYLLLVLVIGFIALIDFLTLGYLKRFKWFTILYWPFYRFLGIVTLSRFYRPIYYSLISNFKKWQVSLFLLFFLVISIYSATTLEKNGETMQGFSAIDMWHNSRGLAAYSGYYDDQNEKGYSNYAHIQSDIITGKTLRLFVVLRADQEDSIKKNCQYKEPSLANLPQRDSLDLSCLRTFYQVSLDDSLLQNLTWRYHDKPHTGQRGLLTWIDIGYLPAGVHTVSVSGPPAMYPHAFADIPFYLEK